MAMPRPLTVALTAISVGLIVLLAVLFFKKNGRPVPVRTDVPDSAILYTSPGTGGDGKPAPRRPVLAARRPAPSSVAHPDAGQPAADETSLLEQLHDLAGSNPELSLKLAREAVARFPDSPNAPEFEWNVVKALFNMRRLDEAEAEARVMLSKYPGNYFTGDVVHHLLHHPPNPSDVPQ
jgi:hypothetical protein